MEAFRTEEACARRRRVAFSNIQQSLRAAAVDEEQLKRQLDEMRNCFTTARTQQDAYLFLECLTRAHDDFTFGLTTNTRAIPVNTCPASTSRRRACRFCLRVDRCTDA